MDLAYQQQSAVLGWINCWFIDFLNQHCLKSQLRSLLLVLLARNVFVLQILIFEEDLQGTFNTWSPGKPQPGSRMSNKRPLTQPLCSRLVLYLSICLSVCLSVYLCCLSVRRYVSIYLSSNLPTYLSTYLSIHLSIYLSYYLI